MPARILGLDIGTTSVKVQAFTERLEPLALARIPYGAHVDGNRFEQDPEEIWAAVGNAVRALGDQLSLDRVITIGVDGQTPTLVLLDASGACLTPCLGWRDVRAEAEANELADRFPPAWRIDTLNAILPVSASWPPARMLWFSRHHPDLIDKARHAFSIKDFVVYRLTGAAVTDTANARGFVHAPSGRPIPELVGYAHADDLLPPTLAPWALAGTFRSGVGTSLGLPNDVSVAVGWGDLYAAILGSGALDDDGRAFDITGTAEGIGVTGPNPVEAEGLVSMPVWDGRCVTYGSTQAGCGSVEWWLRAGGAEPAAGPDVVDEAARGTLDRQPTIIFLPHLGGERAPLWDTEIRGAFLGLELETDWPSLSRAVLEGVACSIRQVLDLAESATPSKGPIRVAGAAAGSRVWNQIKANVTARPVEALQIREASALGAAMLGAVAAGVYGSPEEASRGMRRPLLSIEPQAETTAAYERLYVAYRAAQDALRPVHRLLAEMRDMAPQASGERSGT